MKKSWIVTGALLLPYAPSIELNHSLILKPAPHHHFNTQAPHSCGSGTLVKLEPTKMTCKFATPGASTGKVGVCDDGETFCKIETFSVSATVKN